GMATRFGGGAKGAVRVHPDHALSFLGLALRDATRVASACGARLGVPVVIMTSFATHADVCAHLEANDWFGVSSEDRFVFGQSIMPRIDAHTGVALYGRYDAAKISHSSA